jgi:curved DNA-binding protein CbpA
MSDRDPYDVLGVAPHTDPGTIAAAYRELARRHHPDVSSAPDAERRMAEVNAAWSILRDPERRAAWDRAHPQSGAAAHTGQATVHEPTPAAWAGGPSQPVWRRGPNGEGAAGPPPGPRRGSVLPFGRHIGWSLGEIARVDAGYLAWLRERPEGAPYRDEIDQLLAAMRGGAAPVAAAPPPRRRGIFGS